MLLDLEYFDKFLINNVSLHNPIEEIPINGNCLKNIFKDDLTVIIPYNNILNNYIPLNNNILNNNLPSNNNLPLNDNLTLDNKNQKVLTKKRQRQLQINKSSQKTRKKIKLKLNLMETHITKTQQLITNIHNSLHMKDIPNLILYIENANNEMKNYNEYLIKELKKIK